MKQGQLLEQISAVLAKLESLVHNLKQGKIDFHEIEKDIAREDIRKLYGLFGELYEAGLLSETNIQQKEKPKKESRQASPGQELNLFSVEKKDEIAASSHKNATTENLQPGLKKAIGINDKFFFINELFEGNLKEYNDLITELETRKTAAEASELLEKNYKEREWEKHEDAFSRLQQFVERNIR